MDEAKGDRLNSYIDFLLSFFTLPFKSSIQNQKSQINNLIEPLTERELEVLRLMAEGLKYEEIAGRLFISLNTVRTYVKGIYGKLNVNNRTKAIAAAHQHRLI
jgi:LuxR family maltose regulon positive regulatory protein